MFTSRGRYYRWQKKALITDHLRLTAHKMLGNGAAEQHQAAHSWAWSRGGEKVADLVYQVRPAEHAVLLIYSYQKQPITPYLIYWETSTPHYGGTRYWWRCPLCGRRCADLFSGRTFACRRCYDLTYASAQSGDPRSERVERRMWAIRRRLGAEGGLLDDVPAGKPRFMHWSTYERLLAEYGDLQTIWLGDLGLMVGLAAERPEIADLTQQLWADYQKHPRQPAPRRKLSTEEIAATIAEIERLRSTTEATRPATRGAPRRTLGQTAKAAAVPLDFAREAQAEGLLRPDGGRDQRAKRYRPKVASWLAKLQTLRQAGYTWAELRAWSARRFQPGHEAERGWPAGYRVTAAP